MVVCYNNHFLISSGLVSLFTTAQASNWTRVTSLDNMFARANSTYGSTGGSSTHTHTTTTGYTTSTETGTSDTILAPFSATGGTVTTSGGYTIHTFTSSGTFTPNQAGTVDVLLVAGGGGGGSGNNQILSGGGGGGGGVVYKTNFSILSSAWIMVSVVSGSV